MEKRIRALKNDAQKFSLIKREAIYTGIALIGLIIFWLIAGFGLSTSEIKIFHLPIWAVASTVGVWLFAIVISAILSKILFKNVDLGGADDE